MHFGGQLLHLLHDGQLLLHLAVHLVLHLQLVLLALFSDLLDLELGVLDALGPVGSGDEAVLVAFLDHLLVVRSSEMLSFDI